MAHELIPFENKNLRDCPGTVIFKDVIADNSFLVINMFRDKYSECANRASSMKTK